MESNSNIQMKTIFKRCNGKMKTFYKWKFITAIICIITSIIFMFVPFFGIGESMAKICSDAGYEISSEEEKALLRLFETQDKIYKETMKEIDDLFGSQVGSQNNELGDLAFSYTNYAFWNSIESVVGGSLSSSEKDDLVRAYRNSTLLSYFTFIVKDLTDNFSIVGSETVAEFLNFLFKIFVGTMLIMPLISLVLSIIIIFNYFVKNEKKSLKDFEYFYIDNLELKTNHIMQNYCAFYLPPLFVLAAILIAIKFAIGLIIKINWSIIFILLAVVISIVLDIISNKAKSNLEFAIAREKKNYKEDIIEVEEKNLYSKVLEETKENIVEKNNSLDNNIIINEIQAEECLGEPIAVPLVEEIEEQTEINFCSKCGSKLQNDVTFCPRCGSKLK